MKNGPEDEGGGGVADLGALDEGGHGQWVAQNARDDNENRDDRGEDARPLTAADPKWTRHRVVAEFSFVLSLPGRLDGTVHRVGRVKFEGVHVLRTNDWIEFEY